MPFAPRDVATTFWTNRQLKSLIVHNATTTRSRLTLTAREHYERELKQQAFLMLGSLEAFGNPVGLVRGMGQVCTIAQSCWAILR